MVYKCLYCGSTSKNNDEHALSFHSFPKDQRRYLWLDSLDLSNAGKWDKICSKHFNPQHFMVGVLKNTLFSDAVPMPTDFKNDKNLSCNQIEENLVLMGTPVVEHTSEESVTPQYQSKRKLFSNSSESPKKVLCSSSRFDNLEEKDFSTPRRAKKNFNSLKRTVLDIREKNRCLMQKNHCLEQRINLLNKSIKDQHDKLLQTNTTTDSKVFIF